MSRAHVLIRMVFGRWDAIVQRDVIRGKALYTVQPRQTAREVAAYMTQNRVGAVPVIEGDRLVGIFSERDLMTRVVAPCLNPDATPVGSVMTKDIVVADADETTEACLVRMKQLHVRHLPVVSGDKLVGMLSVRNLLMVDATQKEEEIRWLNAYIHYAPPGWG